MSHEPETRASRTLAELSAAQRRLWYMSQLDDGNPFYNVTLAMRLRLAVDACLLQRALATLVRRHEILRTRYPIVNGLPMQEVMDPEGFSLKVVRRPVVGVSARDSAVEEFARKIARTRLVLQAHAPFRAWLLSVADDDHVLVLLTHHIATDQRSINLLTTELERLYEAYRQGHQPVLPDPVQYQEFVRWETERLQRQEPELRAFWDRQLETEPHPLPLPFDRRPQRNSQRFGAEHQFQLTADATTRFRAFCRRGRASEFMGLFALWAALLHRYTQRSSIFVGTTTAFREHRRFNASQGCFINTLALRLDIHPQDTFADLLARGREQIVDAFEHAGFSYERLIERLRTLGLGAKSDFINAYLQFQTRSMTLPADAPRRFKPNINVHNGRAKFPLMLNVSDRGSTLDCTLEYESDAFTSRTILAMARDLARVVDVAGGDPGARLDTLKLELSIPSRSDESHILATGLNQVDDEGPARPFTATEATLAGIWRDLLLVAPTRPGDDFLALGGHSLLTAQLAWKLRQSMGIAVRIRDLHDASRLETMARLVDAAPRAREAPSRRPATEAVLVRGVPCQIELGTWSIEKVDSLIASLNDGELSAGERVARTAFAFWGTPFQFESRRPLPLRGRLPVRLGAFDCATFVYTALALGLSRNFGEFIETLRALRYRDPESATIDSDPESGTIFDFVEESLVVNAVELGLLTDVTPEIANGTPLETLRTRLVAVRRDASRDPLELWATPKLGRAPIAMSLLPRTAFDRLGPKTALKSGDIVMMARGTGETGHVVDHVGIAHVDHTGSYLLQSTRHFAWSSDPRPSPPVRYTGIFYDEARRCEQIGVGIGGGFVGDDVSFTRDGMDYHGYEAGGRRLLIDYLDGAQFNRMLVLRPTLRRSSCGLTTPVA